MKTTITILSSLRQGQRIVEDCKVDHSVVEKVVTQHLNDCRKAKYPVMIIWSPNKPRELWKQ